MTGFAFLGALSVAAFVFEIISAFQYGIFRHSRLDGAFQDANKIPQRRSTWDAVLIAIFPKRFDPEHAKNMLDVVGLIRRAGYPYDTPGEFYAIAIREFSKYLLVGGLMAGALATNGMLIAAPLFAAFYIYLGLRRPYTRLEKMAKARAETMRNNMLIALSVLESLLSSGVGVQDAYDSKNSALYSLSINYDKVALDIFLNYTVNQLLSSFRAKQINFRKKLMYFQLFLGCM